MRRASGQDLIDSGPQRPCYDTPSIKSARNRRTPAGGISVAKITRVGLEIHGPSGEKFKVTDYLGAGFFGEVYRAVGTESGTVVAVKLLPVPEHDDESLIALLNEIRSAAQIVHPNVVRVLHVDNGSIPELGPYVVMEYLGGGTLAKILRSQRAASAPVPLGRAREMMIDIAQGAKAINERLIHRDIRPDNILVDENHLKLGDFGISKFVDESTRDKTFKGGQNIRYMAPEGWESAANTFKLDTYSVAIVFFEILALEHPFEHALRDANDWHEWERVHLFETCPDVRSARAEVSAAIAQLIQRMLSKRPQERPDWDDVLRILTTLNSPRKRRRAIREAVEVAIRKTEEQRQAQLAEAERAREEEKRKARYIYSCNGLLKVFNEVVEEFNSEFQHGKISVQHEPLEDNVVYIDSMLDTTYTLPTGGVIRCYFFPDSVQRCTPMVKVRGARVIGGGFIGIGPPETEFGGIAGLVQAALDAEFPGGRAGRSANLLLFEDLEDDLYGRWVVCEVDITALADRQKLVGSLGITAKTVFPFGFKEGRVLFDQMSSADVGKRIFSYSFTNDVARFFAELVKDAMERSNLQQA
jgi:serine/threonine protein kinase